MDDGAAFEGRLDKGNLIHHAHIVGRQAGYVKSTGRARFEDQIGRAVVVDELADVAAFLAEWPETADIAVGAIDGFGGGDADAGIFITLAARLRIVEMEVHDEGAGGLVVIDLGPLQDKVFAETIGIFQAEGLAFEPPAGEVARRIGGDETGIGRVAG